jgi:hypothetical protein
VTVVQGTHSESRSQENVFAVRDGSTWWVLQDVNHAITVAYLARGLPNLATNA